MDKRLMQEVRRGKFEKADNGLFLPAAKVFLQGVFAHEIIRAGRSLGKIFDPNTVVNEGLDHILDVVFHAGSQIGTWYIGIFEGDYTPVAGDTAGTITANSTESTAYDEATRVEWNEAAPSGQSIDNSANRAQFTMNASKTIYGAFLVSNSTKSGTTGTLMSASRFSASRSVVASDQLLITYTFTAADA